MIRPQNATPTPSPAEPPAERQSSNCLNFGRLPRTSDRRKPAAGEPVFGGAAGYILATLSVAIACAARYAFDPLWGTRFPYVLFFVAVFVVIQLAGTGAVLTALGLSLLAADWFFISPRHSLVISDPADRINSVLFVLITLLMLYFTSRMRRALIRERYAQAELHKNVEALGENQARLESALAEVKTLSGLLPICSHCKKIRDDRGYWNQIEHFIRKHSNAKFTHGICPECSRKFYPELFPGK